MHTKLGNMTIVRHGMTEVPRLYSGWSMFFLRTLIAGGLQVAIFRNARVELGK